MPPTFTWVCIGVEFMENEVCTWSFSSVSKPVFKCFRLQFSWWSQRAERWVEYHRCITCEWASLSRSEEEEVEEEVGMLVVWQPGETAAKQRNSVWDRFECLNRRGRLILATSGVFSSHVCGNKSGYFKPRHDASLTLTKWFLCLNLTRR